MSSGKWRPFGLGLNVLSKMSVLYLHHLNAVCDIDILDAVLMETDY